MSDFVSKRFKEENQGDFCYRVYQSMSVGDFVVAIRCNNPEVPFEVASMLRDHKTYLDIAEKTGASTATISRVNRSLNYGNDGYELVFNRLPQK